MPSRRSRFAREAASHSHATLPLWARRGGFVRAFKKERLRAVYRTEFKINAGDARVWSILTDFDSYGEWNPPAEAGVTSEEVV